MKEKAEKVSKELNEEKSTAPNPDMNAEQIAIIRTNLQAMVQKNYKAFVQSIQEIPIHPASIQQAFLFMDTGILWIKEALAFAPFVQQQPPVSPESPAPDTKPSEGED